MNVSPITVWVAGTSVRTASCLHTLLTDPRIKVAGVITPALRTNPNGVTIENPVHALATEKKLKTVFITTNRIDSNVKLELQEIERPDIVLVVDFGYFVPKWLLDWPKRAPINIHPSLLPRWRGSSPGQYVLLYGEENSAVTIMIMNEGLDTGPIITQIPFKIQAEWTTTEYYEHAFQLVNKSLADTLIAVANSSVNSINQPEESPTLTARRLTRDDGFIGWQTLLGLLAGTLQQTEAPLGDISQLLLETQIELQDLYSVMANASRAFSPWPGLWTIASTTKGDKRLKLLSVEKVLQPHLHLRINALQIEGQQPATVAEVKSLIPDFQTVKG